MVSYEIFFGEGCGFEKNLRQDNEHAQCQNVFCWAIGVSVKANGNSAVRPIEI